MGVRLGKRIGELSLAVITAGLLSLSASAAAPQANSKFQVRKQRIVHRTEIKIQKTENYLKRLEGYKACVEKSNNYKELNECKVKFGFYHHHHHHHKSKNGNK